MNGPYIIFLNRFFAPDESATSRILSDLAFTLAEEGWPVIVVTSRMRHNDPAPILPPQEMLRGVRVVRVATSGFGRASLLGRLLDYATFYLAAAWILFGIVGAGDVVVAKTDPPLVALVAAPLVRWRRARLVCWMQDIYPEVAARLGIRFVAGPIERVLAALRDRVLRSADRTVVLGDTMARLIRNRGVPSNRIVVLHNWAVDEGGEPITAANNPLRRVWGLEGKFVVGYSGNLGRAHEPWTMLEAARLLADDLSIRFVMIGEGYLTGELKARVAEAGLTNVDFHPLQPAAMLPQSLGVPDVHWASLVPSLEGLIVPSKIYGVLAAGRPLIAISARDGETGSLVVEYDCGIQVDPGDAAGFVSAIRGLRDDPGRLVAMGEQARRLATERFSRVAAIAGWRGMMGELGIAQNKTQSACYKAGRYPPLPPRIDIN